MYLTAVSADNVYSVPVRVRHPLGLHLRAAANLVRLASRFDDCDINLRLRRHHADAKCLMDVVMLAAASGSELHLEADGDRAEVAVATLSRFFESGFYSPA